ncbi:uncharacterized protein LOC141661049 [Apium graveolens]|uniref:uncharacterized protein LOC141661049 n=1 Tax=Apium graveolens TaxID=4045 RepID=UPI003D7979DF
MKIEKDKDFRWPKPLRGDPEKRDKNQFCRFHKDVGHDTNDCRQLKDELEYLIRREKCGRFIKGDDGGGHKRDDDQGGNNRGRNVQPRGPMINIISGGPTGAVTTMNSRKAYTREVMNIVGDAPKCAKTKMTLKFGDPDLDGLKFPHDDALVITPIIENCSVKRVLVNIGTFVDILFHETFLRMGYSDSQLTPSDAPIYGLNKVECQVEGAIRLPVFIGEEPREATQLLKF